jgi:hypothetical protein
MKGPLQGIARRADPLALYSRLYRARVLAQSGDLMKVDVEPEDRLLPLMSNIPLRHGIPGITVSISPGAYVMIGWENGRPDLPFAANWANPSSAGQGNARADSGKGGGGVQAVALVADLVEIGGRVSETDPFATEAMPLFESYRRRELVRDSLLLTTINAIAAAIAADSAVPPPLKGPVAAAISALTTAQTDLSSFDWFSTKARNA